MTEPCTLPCKHTFCLKCISDVCKTSPRDYWAKGFPCPLCREEVKFIYKLKINRNMRKDIRLKYAD